MLGLPLVNKKFDQVERSQILDTLDKLASGKDDKGSANAGTWKMEYTDEDLRFAPPPPSIAWPRRHSNAFTLVCVLVSTIEFGGRGGMSRPSSLSTCPS